MSTTTSTDEHGTSTRPYLIRGLHEWCTDNGFTPYIAVYVTAAVQVPMEYVKNHEIVLNIGFEATSGLKLGNEFIEFRARFGGVTREIVVPVDHVVAIYARENGQGMAFPAPNPGDASAAPAAEASRGAALRLAGGSEPGLGVVSDAPMSPPADDESPSAVPDDEGTPEPPMPPSRPTLKRIK